MTEGSPAATTDHRQAENIEDKLKNSLSLLEASLESTADGILAVDNQGKIVVFNSKFAKMWRIPRHILDSRDDDKALSFVLTQLKRPEAFLEKVNALHSSRESSSFDVVEFIDGRIFERYSQPQRVGDLVVGRVWSFRDVTENRRAERALRESEAKYRLIAENTADLISVLDMDLHFTYVSPASVRLRGFSVEEAMAQTLDQVLTPESMAVATAVFEEEMLKEASGKEAPDRSRTLELKQYKKDGTTMWMEVSLSFLRDTDGKPLQILAVSRDISDRKRAETALRESEERFRLAFLTSPDSININRVSDGLYLDINEGFTKALGYSREDVLGKTSVELNIWKNIEDRNRLVAGLLETGFVENLEAEFIDKQGNSHIGLMSARLLRMGDEEVILSITREISDRIRAERELQQSEERYRSLVENTLEGYFICEIPSCRFLFLNKSSCDMFGYDRQQALAMTIWDIIDPKDRPLVQKRIQARIDGKQPAFTSNIYNVVRKDGSVIKAEVSTSLITYQGKFVIQGVIRDVTETQRLQQQLQQAQKFEAIGTLAGGIAHDFNNLLMGIQGRASLISADLEASHPSQEHIQAMEEYVKSAVDLTKQLLGFVRAGKYEIKPIEINQLVVKSADMFARTRKEIRIHTKPHPSSLVAEIDKQQIEQALLNILINAWQAMPEGGDIYVQISGIALEGPAAESRRVKPGPYARISITDTGIGIKDSIQQQIFDPFFTTKDKSRGTGLGLASVYGIVKNHGGTITVKSRPGHGATFDIYLPASNKPAHQELPEGKQLKKGMETILVVDDEKMIIDVACAMLRRLGYRVLSATGGQQALTVMEQTGEDIDLVILDLIMPGMDGGQVFDRLREMRPRLPVIISSGYAIDGEAAAIMNRGCNGFIQKPFNMSEISRKLREVLDDAKGSPSGSTTLG